MECSSVKIQIVEKNMMALMDLEDFVLQNVGIIIVQYNLQKLLYKMELENVIS